MTNKQWGRERNEDSYNPNERNQYQKHSNGDDRNQPNDWHDYGDNQDENQYGRNNENYNPQSRSKWNDSNNYQQNSNYGNSIGNRSNEMNYGNEYAGGTRGQHQNFGNNNYGNMNRNQNNGGINNNRSNSFDSSDNSGRNRGSGFNPGGMKNQEVGNMGEDFYAQSAYRNDNYGQQNPYSTGNTNQGTFGNSGGIWRGNEGVEQGKHKGRGPKGYTRSDERISDDINDKLSDDENLDASEIEVKVTNGEVILTGTVNSRYEKRMADDIVEGVSGVKNVENRLRIQNSRYGVNGETGNYNKTDSAISETLFNNNDNPSDLSKSNTFKTSESDSNTVNKSTS